MRSEADLPVTGELGHSDCSLNASLRPLLLVREVSIDHFLCLEVRFEAECAVKRQLACGSMCTVLRNHSLVGDAIEVSAVDQARDERLESTSVTEDALSDGVNGSLKRWLCGRGNTCQSILEKEDGPYISYLRGSGAPRICVCDEDRRYDPQCGRRSTHCYLRPLRRSQW